MQLNLGEKIRELRHRDSRTQEDLANALGITSQAVSRWESGGSYPDMEMIPSIANFFGITIDELFGYQSDRDQKIDAILAKVDAFGIKARGDDAWVDDCLAILREGLAEFPQNERLLITLADTLSEAGWRRHGEWIYYDDEGYMQHGYDRHKKNPYWTESVKLCETLLQTAHDPQNVTKALSILVLLYRNFGENEKAAAYARRMPELKYCRELQLAASADGKEEAKYVGAALLQMASKFAEQLVYGLIANRHHYESDFPIKKIEGVISLFHLLCDDGNFGDCNGDLCKLYLYLSRLQWEKGYHDEAFQSLDQALAHARMLEALFDGNVHAYTAPLLSFVECRCFGTDAKIARTLPDDWPFWCNPDYTEVEKEIKADPRWNAWVQKTQQ